MLTPKAWVEKASPQNSPMASEWLLPRNSKPRSDLKMSLWGRHKGLGEICGQPER